MRVAWWIEDKLRVLLNVRALDLSAEWNPLLGCLCLSVYVPKQVKWREDFTKSLEALENNE